MQKEQFIEKILSGARSTAPAPSSKPLAVFKKIGLPKPAEAPAPERPFALSLLEECGFGAGQTLARTEVVLGDQKTKRFLPHGVTYWPDAAPRKFQILLFELELSGKKLLADPFFRDTDQLEDALHRIVQDALDGFEHGGTARSSDRKQGAQNKTLCVVSVADDRLDGPTRQLVCFGTKCDRTSSMEVFTLREEARDWAARGDRALAEEHLGQLFERHFKPLSLGDTWQDAFVSDEEHKKVDSLLEACTVTGAISDSTELKGAIRNLLDEIAWSFGLPRKADEKHRCLDMKDLPLNHSLAVDPDDAARQGFENPLRGVRIYDGTQRLLGFIVYVTTGKADLNRLQLALKTHNHFHNVLVICPDADSPAFELWQGGVPLRGRLISGNRRSCFDGKGGIIQLLSRFFVVSRTAIATPTQLATELAWRARHLRALVLDELTRETAAGSGPVKALFDVFNQSLATLTPAKFGDAYAQAITYGMLAARWLSADGKLLFTRKNLGALLPSTSAFLRDLFEKLVNSNFDKNVTWLLDDITSLLARTSVSQVFRGQSDPSIHFYQDFLDAYDPQIRRDMGVYYTPDEVVVFMVRSVDQLIREKWELPLGLAAKTTWREWAAAPGHTLPSATNPDDYVVQVLDPATGTGTFLLHTLDVIFETMLAEYERLGYDEDRAAAAWKAYVKAHLLPRINAFELMMAPYIVCHLRIGLALERGLAEQRGLDLEKWGFRFSGDDRLRIFLTNTLELHTKPQIALLGDHVAQEAQDAERIKQQAAISVIIGNPPYDRVARGVAGGAQLWILSGQVPGRKSDKSLFDDILDVARANTIFSHHASLYNLYVYFWRWSFWKAFERDAGAPGIVALITASSWLTGPGFVGLREMARRSGDELWSVDLGGDNKGANPEPNIFNIETPVAITVVERSGIERRSQTIAGRYRRISGDSGAAKLRAVKVMLDADSPLAGPWMEAGCDWLESLVPATGGLEWQEMPRLDAIFPLQQPGCKYGRLWPIATSSHVLSERWKAFVGSPVVARPDLYYTAPTGRTIHTQVAGLSRLAEEQAGAVHRAIRRYGYRSFDRQWAFEDPRLAALERPSLWAALSDRQIFLASQMTNPLGSGPGVTVSAHLPDLHYFCGRGGKDIVPLYRDGACSQANVTRGLLALVAGRLQVDQLTAEDLAAYVYALLSTSAYQVRFAKALETPGLRVPLTANRHAWRQAVQFGRRLLWLHTYAERFGDPADGRGTSVPDVPTIRWVAPLSEMPEKPSDIKYNDASETLTLGDGTLGGVRKDVWDFEVSGMPIVKKWLGYRTRKGAGRAASSTNPLDKIRPTEWAEEWNHELMDLLRVLTLTLDMQPELSALLDEICDGPLIAASELPTPTAAERAEPKVKRSSQAELF